MGLLFISHSEIDKNYIEAFIDLIKDIGINEKVDILCSSLPDYWIPVGQNIYDYLKNNLNNNEAYVIMFLSDNYYTSAACLNEMGAAWILSREVTAILLPTFEFNEIRGAIDPRNVSFKLDMKDRVKEFVGNLLVKYKVENCNNNLDKEIDEFINKIQECAQIDMENLRTKPKIEFMREEGNYVLITLSAVNRTNKIRICKSLEVKFTDNNYNDNDNVVCNIMLNQYLNGFVLKRRENGRFQILLKKNKLPLDIINKKYNITTISEWDEE